MKTKKTEWIIREFFEIAQDLVRRGKDFPLTFILQTDQQRPRVYSFIVNRGEDKEKILHTMAMLINIHGVKYYSVLFEYWGTTYSGNRGDYPYREIRLDPDAYEGVGIIYVSPLEKRFDHYRLTPDRGLERVEKPDGKGEFGGCFFDLFLRAEELKAKTKDYGHVFFPIPLHQRLACERLLYETYQLNCEGINL